MASYQLSEEAREDVDGIYDYSILTFGLQQARRYASGLHERLSDLAESPDLRRGMSEIRDDVYRFEYVSHAIYYTITSDGFLVLRVLHRRMDPGQHL